MQRIDINLIKEKLKQKQYNSIDEFNSEMQNMFQNWVSENGT